MTTDATSETDGEVTDGIAEEEAGRRAVAASDEAEPAGEDSETEPDISLSASDNDAKDALADEPEPEDGAVGISIDEFAAARLSDDGSAHESAQASAGEPADFQTEVTEDSPAGPPPAPSFRVSWGDRRARILAAAATLSILQLGVLAHLLSRQFFYQDDLELEHNAHFQGLGWQYLMTPHNGHLMPGGMAVAWIVTRLSPMNWAVAAGSILVMQAVASFAVLRLLRVLFGVRPAILVFFGFYLFGAANMPVAGWWAPALEVLPLEAMLAFALGSHIIYLRTGERRDAWRAVLFSVLGLLFMAKAIAIPPLLFALTVCYFSERPTVREALVDTIRRHWRIWPVYIVILGLYEVLYQQRLSLVHMKAAIPDSVSAIWQFSEHLLGHTYAPAVLGGPWKWSIVPDSYEFADTPVGLVYASWAVLLAIVVAAMVFRRRAGRAWLILAGYLVVGDLLPILAGRISILPSSWALLLGGETRYVSDAMVVTAVCAGLAFLAREGETDPYRQPLPTGARSAGLGQALVGALSVVAAVGLAVSVISYHGEVNGDVNRAWYAHARAALAAGTAGSSILDVPVPEKLNLHLDYDKALTSFVLAPVASKEQLASMPASQPIDNAFAFDAHGDLRPVLSLDGGAVGLPGPIKDYGYCFGGEGGVQQSVDVMLPTELAWEHWSARIVFIDHDATALDVKFGIAEQELHLPAQMHFVTFNLPGNGNLIRLSGVTSQHALCVARLEIGKPTLG